MPEVIMSCLGCCRSYTTIPHISTRAPPVSFPQKSPSESKNIITSSAAASSPEAKKIDNCSPICLPPAIESLVKKRRTRRRRPPDSYTKAITAFYTLYPRIFSDQDEGCPLVKIEPRSPAEQELPALLSRLQQVDNEVRLIISNLQHVNSPSPSPSPLPSPSKAECSPGLLDEEPSEAEESCVESLLESSEMIDGGMDSILGGAESLSGEHNNHPLCVFGDGDGVDMSMRVRYLSAIRRSSDIGLGAAEAAVWSVPASLRMRPLKDKLKAEKEMNAMSFCSLDEAQHDKLSLKLDYQEVLTAWSGSLYTEGHCPQTVPDDDDDEHDDSSSVNENASMDFGGLVPDLRFWRFGEESFIQSCYTVEDAGSSTMNDGMDAKTGGIREARVLRYKEKRQTRLFSKKIRYEVRKLNAEKRPRMKGRFVKTGSD